ncbi:mitochondrial basic amino acids transporter-like [Apostichopus japonicus]|uniref:mitochondrial basic amino acids transporter-like n=1 Tax=Stichopus japonicus TaxID=307972 RepID=UPI003AB829D3
MAVDFIAGLNGGLAGLIAVHPLDTVKVRIQMQSNKAPRYHGNLHCIVMIMKQESPASIYKGLAFPALTTSSLNALVFGAYGPCIRRLDSSKLSHHFLAGSAAGLVQSPLCCVVELSKIRVQMQGVGEKTDKSSVRVYRGSISAVLKIFRSEGLAGCSKGLILVTARDVPGFGVYFASYAGLCNVLGKTPSEDLSFMPLMVAGGLSGVLSWGSVYALDVVKTRFQADGIDGNRKYSNYSDVVREIYTQNGMRGFFAGLSVTLIRAFPANAALFGAATLTHRLLGSQF